ncbi:MAG: ATP-binding protein [Anaerolineales bacterium]|nr:ATP-binding protein [Anaerolineales bacterium]
MTDRLAIKSKSQRLERLLEISRTLSATLDLKALLDTIIEVAQELTNSEVASLLLYDEESKELRFEASPGFQRDDLQLITVPLESSVAGWVFTNRRPMVIQEAREDPRVYREVDEKLGFVTQSILGVPLIVKGEPLGVLEAVNKLDDGHYTEDDLAILETLAAQAAVAIENVRLLQSIQNANEELKRLDRMKSDFIAIASHELRTPLGLILGHATFLKEIIPTEQQEQMEVIIRSAMRLKTIIEDMATIAHKEQGQSRVRREPFSMSRMIEETASSFREEARNKGIDFEFDVPVGDALMVEGDREKLDIVLRNLIKNALTFTDPGGQIRVKAEGDGGLIKVFVVDTGIGIPEKDVGRVFDRFYQVESHLTRKHGGMGLGLSIAKAMVDMHNGQIWCESKEGTGSLFCFIVPTTQEAAENASKVFKSS